ncbi:MAG: hypothetical protein HKN72_14730 [Gemmatimonadetes bacterium]|nr:hypothetical protein [Gemmatimonadota bacterium]
MGESGLVTACRGIRLLPVAIVCWGVSASPLNAQASLPQLADTVLYERLDLYDPVTGEFAGSEETYWAPDGRRLRLDVRDATGASTLLFYLGHDALGRESNGRYFESDPFEPWFERFSYSADGRMRTTTYVLPDGGEGDRTESDLDESGREVFKRYYRADGSRYGEEDVNWNDDGTSAGWEFRYLERADVAAFTYDYQAVEAGGWTHRLRLRNGEPERLEVRTVWRAGAERPFPTGARFAPDAVSTDGSETSPSFTSDARTMVFARYGDDWALKEPFIARLGSGGWSVAELDFGPVYNLSIAPDGASIIFARSVGEARTLHRVRREGEGWSRPEDLSSHFGLAGSYPLLTTEGDLYVYDVNGPRGEGIYFAPRRGDGFAPAEPTYIPESGDAFDAWVGRTGGPLLMTRCFDATCASGPTNGVWLIDTASDSERKLANVPYAWGVQPVEALGLFVFTDGEDILALPLSVVMPEGSSHAHGVESGAEGAR